MGELAHNSTAVGERRSPQVNLGQNHIKLGHHGQICHFADETWKFLSRQIEMLIFINWEMVFKMDMSWNQIWLLWIGQNGPLICIGLIENGEC